jgi:ParB-like chromosome segregation protein Spo0J
MKSRTLKTVRITLHKIKPSDENELLYKPIREDDPARIALAESIRKKGVFVPLTVTADGYILDRHRRRVPAGMAGLKPCHVE